MSAAPAASDADAIRTSTVVSVAPGTAFRIFTEEIDRWWRGGPRFRFHPERGGVLRFERAASGRRLVEAYPGSDHPDHEIGRVLAWEPPDRLCFEFRAHAFAEGETTEVEIRFEAVHDGTRVALVHRGFDAFADTHPVRHGLVGPAFRAMMGLWWGDLLVSARAHADGSAAV